MDFYVVWVPGRGMPKVVHQTKERAIQEAERLRKEATNREVYVLTPCHVVPGRKLLGLPKAPNSLGSQSPDKFPIEADTPTG